MSSGKRSLLKGTLKQLVYAAVYGCIGLVVGGLTFFVMHQLDRPDLKPWQTVYLDAEFHAADSKTITSLADYRKLEDRLFAQLQQQVVATGAAAGERFNRFNPGSWSEPARFKTNWNRTFELDVEHPRAAVLMLHGMSDSPYSLRSLGEALHQQGMTVVGLRLPGHGTAPSGLTRVRWEDFAAAVRLAARDLSSRVGKDVPLYLLGYSNGAALAIEYSIAVLEGEDLPRPAGLVLLSPEIAVSPAAKWAWLNAWLGRVPGWQKLAWLDIQPEFDPFKYNSFTVNAGQQAYELTSNIQQRLQALNPGGGIDNFPRMLAFQSVVDATVSARALVDDFMRSMAPGAHELVLFDVNQTAETALFLRTSPAGEIDVLLDRNLPFNFTLITNRTPHSRAVVEQRYPGGTGSNSGASRGRALPAVDVGLEWPQSVYSLSHVALPFTPDDLVYGSQPPPGREVPTLGSLEPRGERSLLQVPVSQLMRLRYNPFYDYVEKRVLAFVAPGSE